MNQEEIMEMWNSITKYAPSEVRITEFAHLVAAKATAKEREVCAKIVEENANRCGVDTVAWMLLASNAQAIRARGEA